ncbi:glycosyl transferase [Thioalkalivibrio denitrificans]|uniref:Glycosyl transferase n=1 Tax=Thioalkalivibrio denitrificans TaxID=108003 RepID=A0A1V3NMA4_9GAMM|nr:TIGR04283 family arsenosugar biosynthesis glycosyltransferase [Thioalkalivibrio denitrificans]OOG25962.1 glycosyl transferase [Thioalkalivibrio denitrificans]
MCGLDALLDALEPLRSRGCEVILVDGGSSDDTLKRAEGRVDRILEHARGRALQMNAGARLARGRALWFLHADSGVPADADRLMEAALARRAWGRFDVRLSGAHPLLRVVETLMNLRSRLTGIATGDQGLFMHAEVFHAVKGFAEIPLMEDIDMSRRLKRHAGRPACLRRRLITSSRRWETRGILRTIVLMWWLRGAYALGASPETLARWYR